MCVFDIYTHLAGWQLQRKGCMYVYMYIDMCIYIYRQTEKEIMAGMKTNLANIMAVHIVNTVLSSWLIKTKTYHPI